MGIWIELGVFGLVFVFAFWQMHDVRKAQEQTRQQRAREQEQARQEAQAREAQTEDAQASGAQGPEATAAKPPGAAARPGAPG